MDNSVKQLQSLPVQTKRSAIATFDTVLLLACLTLAHALTGLAAFTTDWMQWLVTLSAPLFAIPIFARLGLYRAVIRYLGEQALWVAAKAVALATLAWLPLVILTHGLSDNTNTTASVVIIYWALATVAVVGSRLMVRELVWRPFRKHFKGDNVLVYGAGEAGAQLVRSLLHTHDLYPVAFVDDDQRLIGHEVAGLKVHPISAMSKLIENYGVSEVLLAIPSASRARRSEIIRQLQQHKIHARVLPSVTEIAQGKVKISDLREVEVEDLLGRNSIPPNQQLLTRNITDKVVLVTGAGGSIGSELCRQIAVLKPRRLIMLDSSEHALYQIDRHLKNSGHIAAERLQPVLGSVLANNFVEEILRGHKVNTIYHAAAYKHVPLMESNECEGVKNNVFGTLTVAEAAIRTGVETFVLISTDKAVRPTNIMGASKRLAELTLQALQGRLRTASGHGNAPKPVFSIVRFGNVLDSSGSVIPLFREQIRGGGPITVTHPQVTRYFMSIPEAAQLVIQAGAMARGGDVFVLDMGEPVKIIDLARQMVQLSGLQVLDESNPGGDISIELTGLRPGEKLYEELLIGNNPIGTQHPKIMCAEEEMLPWSKLRNILDQIMAAYDAMNIDALRELVMSTAGGRSPDSVNLPGLPEVLPLPPAPVTLKVIKTPPPAASEQAL